MAEPWDYVTLQKKLGLSSLIETYEPYFGRLMAVIQELASTAQPLVHQTWAYLADSPVLDQLGTYQVTMSKGIKAAYSAICNHYCLDMIPVGDAFELARRELGFSRDPDFDYTSPPPGALPREPGSRNV